MFEILLHIDIFLNNTFEKILIFLTLLILPPLFVLEGNVLKVFLATKTMIKIIIKKAIIKIDKTIKMTLSILSPRSIITNNGVICQLLRY